VARVAGRRTTADRCASGGGRRNRRRLAARLGGWCGVLSSCRPQKMTPAPGCVPMAIAPPSLPRPPSPPPHDLTPKLRATRPSFVTRYRAGDIAITSTHRCRIKLRNTRELILTDPSTPGHPPSINPTALHSRSDNRGTGTNGGIRVNTAAQPNPCPTHTQNRAASKTSLHSASPSLCPASASSPPILRNLIQNRPNAPTTSLSQPPAPQEA
jgi:hypothetical protein